MNNSFFETPKAMIFASIGIAINIVLGTIAQIIHIPLLFLDTIGTILVSVVLGPLAGALTGGLTNVIQGFITNPKDIPFALVNIAIGLIVGFIAKKQGFELKTAVKTGLILAVVAPLIGTPIAIFIYGGITGSGTDLIFAWLRATGSSIFTATFIPRITGNIIDKLASCLLVYVLLKRIPSALLKSLKA